VEGVHEELEYIWWDGSQDSIAILINPVVGDFVGVTVTDISTGCSDVFESYIGESDLEVEINPALYVSCPGDTTGPVFDLTISGGTPPYILGWMSPGDTMPETVKPPFDVFGVYYLFITDAVQCVDSVSFEIVADEVPIAGFSFSLSGQTLTMTNESQNAIAFEWSFGDGATSSESDPVHVYEDGGDYTVQLIVYGYCSNDTISQVIHVSGVRTKDIDKEESVVVFPNPNQGSFSVLSDSKDIDAVRIFDFLGREIQYRETGDGIYAISKAIDGMYLVLVTLEGATVVRIVQIQ
jgi:hypothetical protein